MKLAPRLSTLLALALSIIILACDKNYNPDTPPPPTGPTTGRVGSTYRFKATATDPDLQPLSLLPDWDDSSATDWTAPFGSGESVAIEHAWSRPGEFWVSVRARDSKGALSLPSERHTIIIEDTINLAPANPADIVGPDSGVVDSTYEFATVTSDPNHDRVTYRVDWGDGDTSDWSPLIAELDTVRFTHAWNAPGEFFVLAQARDEKGAASGWTNVHPVVIDSLR